MLEEEVRAGDQEREGLRIETQRLRDELSDLRVEAEITVEKLRTAEATIEKLHVRKPLFLTQDTVLPRSPTSEVSRTTTSSPTMSTPPPPRSEASSGAPTPPSPPLSDASANPNISLKTDTLPFRRRSLVPDLSATPRPANSGASRPRHSRAPSLVSSTATSKNRMPPPSRPNNLPEGLPRSSSLYQIKGLIGRMQKIEERVHSVRSKLPPSSTTTPKASPRLASRHSPRLPSVTVGGAIPGGITVRNGARKRMSSSTTSSTRLDDDSAAGRSSSSQAKRLSFGVPQGGPVDRSATATPSSRPSSSRSSNTSHSSAYPYARPSSRSGAPTARTPSALGFQSSQPFVPARPRSSLGGNYTSQPKRGHGHSTSVSESRDESQEAENTITTPSAVRRLTLDKSGIPTPTALKRQSGGFSSSVYGRRPSVAGQHHLEESMPPPPEIPRKLTDVGETY